MNCDYMKIDGLTSELLSSDKEIWINPVGGLGDIIMLSSAIKMSFDIYGKKFNVVRRSQYTMFFIEHPAVEKVGNPFPGAVVICNDYWSRTEFNNPKVKAFDIVLKMFCVPVAGIREGFLSVPHNDFTQTIIGNIPWRDRNVAISVSSESPRKMMHPAKWHVIVQKLLAQRCFVIQIGKINDVHIEGAYSLLGVTNPGQVVDVLKKTDVLITVDNFVMHVANVAGTKTVSIFGPTEASRYAYDDAFAIQANLEKCPERDRCLGPQCSNNYTTSCPLYSEHCIDQINENMIVDMVISNLHK